MPRFLSLTLVILLLCPAWLKAQPAFSPVEDCPSVDEWGSPGDVRVAPLPSGLRVSWIPSAEMPSNIEGFQIYRSQSIEDPFIPLALVPTTVTEFVDQYAAPNTIYYYTVRAFRDDLCSPPSPPVRGVRN